jgi:molybdenum cofactor cytidylyltransferase
MNLAGLLLAAGGATRFGSPKVLAPFHGQPLVRRGVQLLMPRCPAGVHVVVGASADGVRAALAAESVTLVENPDWASGLSTSLVRGVAALPAEAEAVLILLCDQPAITADDLDALIAAWQIEPELIAAAGFRDRLGAHRGAHVPCGFRRRHTRGSGAARSGSGTMSHGCDPD